MVEVACYNLSIYYLTTMQYSARDIINISIAFSVLVILRLIILKITTSIHLTKYLKIPKTKTIVYASIRYYLVYAIFEQNIMH